VKAANTKHERRNTAHCSAPMHCTHAVTTVPTCVIE
jgi:hypothetical protein